MNYDNFTLDNGPVSVRTFERYGKNKFDLKAGLQGPSLEIMKSILIVGRSLKRLEDALSGFGCDDENFATMCKRDLHMPPDFVRECIMNNRVYLPDYCEEDKFEFYYLIAIPHEVLCATRPHVIQYFDDPSQGIAPNMWVTKKSIEFYVALDGSQPKWWDLKFLSPKQVMALPALVAQTGPPPGIRTSNSPSARSSCTTGQPSYHYQDDHSQMEWDTSQAPPTPEEMNDIMLREELEPYSQMPPDPDELHEMLLRDELEPFSQMPPDPVDLDEYLQGASEEPWPSPPDPVFSEPDWQL